MLSKNWGRRQFSSVSVNCRPFAFNSFTSAMRKITHSSLIKILCKVVIFCVYIWISECARQNAWGRMKEKATKLKKDHFGKKRSRTFFICFVPARHEKAKLYAFTYFNYLPNFKRYICVSNEATSCEKSSPLTTKFDFHFML